LGTSCRRMTFMLRCLSVAVTGPRAAGRDGTLSTKTRRSRAGVTGAKNRCSRVRTPLPPSLLYRAGSCIAMQLLAWALGDGSRLGAGARDLAAEQFVEGDGAGNGGVERGDGAAHR